MIPEILFVLFYGVGDCATTKYLINNDARELNPLISLLINKWGFISVLMVKILAIVIVLVIADVEALWIAAIMGILFTIWNLSQIIIHKIKYRNGTNITKVRLYNNKRK